MTYFQSWIGSELDEANFQSKRFKDINKINLTSMHKFLKN